MARINQGFLGNASGKIGSVVFSKWRDLQTARQYQPDIQDANSPAQRRQRSRMVALLQFLKPLNKNFIKFFNHSLAKGSTPWAKAIKDNMQGVSPDGCFPLQNLRLGNPKLPPFTIVESTYNPFIDQALVKYIPGNNPIPNDSFPYMACSILGKYKSDDGMHRFDTRFPMGFFPIGKAFCSFYDNSHEHVFENSWFAGMFWFFYYDTYDIDRHVNPNANLTEPSHFVPVPIVEGFNTDIPDDVIPLDTFSWEYKMKEGVCYLVFSVDVTKTSLVNPKDYTIIIWGVALTNKSHEQSEPIEWCLENNTKEIEISEGPFIGGILGLYALYTNEGLQVSKFNRFYISTDAEGKDHPYFQQIFDCCYAHPASFILSGNQCGFCGNIDELFGELISLWEQGYINGGDTPEPTVETMLKMFPDPNGKVTVTGYIRREGDAYVFDLKSKASLETTANAGYKFSKWEGSDAVDVVALGENKFEIQMSKDRSLIPTFEVV
ncbi:MAG: hypothetical protein A2275_17130 [Bacteroidetes bacterium RIFOXYA12_FULL_35_11]|nr:MAG: hypothetical protein A2X01_07390 [Bacteroidetes bacterium GWF2_35_48]OFY83412.1 MAG: hypothetical protein A2275_17130 [Bacteroidetes bacterium RIFOXYA12_FULL_35_11]HBX50667.1 hypothetical protein [Bacteroidales bacterium]